MMFASTVSDIEKLHRHTDLTIVIATTPLCTVGFLQSLKKMALFTNYPQDTGDGMNF
jgi:hypothetical protein